MEETFDPIPGTPDAEDPRIEIDEFLSVMREATDGLTGIITDDIQTDIGAARAQSELAQSMILGDINADINSAGKLGGKAHSNINKDIATDIDDAAATMIKMGFVIPPADAQNYANQTGNYISVAGGATAVENVLFNDGAMTTFASPDVQTYGVQTGEIPGGLSDVPPNTIPPGMPPHTGGYWALSCGDGYVPIGNSGVWTYCIPYYEYQRLYYPGTDMPTPPPMPGPIPTPTPSPTPTPTPSPSPTPTPTYDPNQIIVNPPVTPPPDPLGPPVEPFDPHGENYIEFKTSPEDPWDLPLFPDLNGPDACLRIREWLQVSRLRLLHIAAILPKLPTIAVVDSGWEFIRLGLTVIGVDMEETGGYTLISKLFRWIDQLFEKAFVTLGIRVDLAVAPMSARAVINLLQRWLGDFVPEVVNQLTYIINTLIPSHLPTQAEANAMHRSGSITDEQWECLTSMNGSFPWWQRRILHGERSKPNVMEVIELLRRKTISKDDAITALRELGFTNEFERNNILSLAASFPPFQDVIRMMVRDVADADLVERYRMDSGFDQKWAEPLKYYGEAQGITDDVAKLYWRAHWHLPSPTALYEMLHRLRPGRVPNNQETTANDIRKALEHDDMLPFWIDRMVAISYRPITRIDTQRAYEIGTFDEAEVLARYQDIGYSPADAAMLTRYSTDLRRSRRNRKLGMPTGAILRGRYVKYLIDADELTEQLRELKYEDEEITTLIRWGDRERKANGRKAVYACAKTKYMKGLVDAGTAMSMLIQGGFRTNDVSLIVNEWCLTLNVKEKLLTASQLCEYFKQGLIGLREFGESLVRLGYNASDANRIMMSCGIELDEENQRALEKAAKEAARAKKAAEKAAKESQETP